MDELSRGQIDIILLSLLENGDKNANELKDELDKNYSSIKQGTLYSSINRLVEQGSIKEYRATSEDGLRRKFYRLTAKGAREYNGFNFKKDISDNDKKVNEQPEIAENYLYSSPSTSVENELDFSDITVNENDFNILKDAITETKSTETKNDEKLNIEEKTTVENKCVFSADNYNLKNDLLNEKNTINNNFDEINEDSVSYSKIEYNSALSALFPKSEPIENNENVEINDDNIKNNEIKSNFNDIYNLAETQGLKIKTSNDTNRYQGAKILHNKLRLHSALILFAIMLMEIFITYFLFNSKVNYSLQTYIKIFLLTLVFPLCILLNYLYNPHLAVKEISPFKNVIEIAIIITINIIFIILAIAVLTDVDLYNFNNILGKIIFPSIYFINIPLYFIIKYSLLKKDIYFSV